MKTLRLGAAVLTVAIALAGCSGATAKKAEPTPEPTPEPPSLLGTWQLTEHDESKTILHTLTFRPERWVIIVTEHDEAGAVVVTHNNQGVWEQTDTTITKIFLPWDEEADRPAAVPARVEKRYTLTADTLVVQRWRADEADADDSTMTRVTDPEIVTALAGSSWELVEEGLTLTFTDAGWRYSVGDRFSVGGSMWTDDADNGAILAVVDAVTPVPEDDLQWWVGQTLRFSYAPSGVADLIGVSLWFNDQHADVGVQWTLDPHEVWQYGNFGWRFTRADS